MRSALVFIVFLLFVEIISAQEEKRKFEIGITTMSFNILKTPTWGGDEYPPNKKHYLANPYYSQYFNELFLRYNLNRFSLRVNSSYIQYTENWSNPCQDCWSGHIDYKEFQVGLGLQYSLNKEKERFYLYLNASYLFYNYQGAMTFSTSRTSIYDENRHYIQPLLGTGYRIMFFKNRLSLSPELGLSFYFDVKDLDSDSFWPQELVFKLPLTVTF